MTTTEYRAGLSARDLDGELETLVDTRRRCDWLLCRYLADMADDRRFRGVGWYSDVQHYARQRFGMSVKSTRERVRIGRALRELPAIEQAFVDGQLGYSRVRELTRVATRADETQWLDLGRRLGMRELERQVAIGLGVEEPRGEPAEVHWRTPQSVELRVQLPASTWALLSRAMQGARQAAEGSMSDAQALEAVAREALGVLCEADGASVGDPRRAVVLYRCVDCGQSELETGAGAVALSPGQAEQLGCGAKVIDLETEGKAEACVGGTMPSAVRRAVLARDRGRCRCCGRRRYVDVHHMEAQSEGGAHRRDNCACLCTGCHAAIHEGKLSVQGSAEGQLRWFGESGRELYAERAAGGGGDAAVTAGGRPITAHGIASVGDDAPPESASGTDEPTGLSEQAVLVLRAMGGRGGWGTDELVGETGLKVQFVSVALLELELSARIRTGPPRTNKPARRVAGRGNTGLKSWKMDAPLGASGPLASSRDGKVGAPIGTSGPLASTRDGTVDAPIGARRPASVQSCKLDDPIGTRGHTFAPPLR